MATEIQISAGSSALEIQAAIDAAPKGAVIRLAAGQYSFDRTVVIDRDDISLIGAGGDKTVITLAKDMNGDPAFRVGQPLFTEELQNPVTIADAQAGDRQITVTGGQHALKAGDAIWIERANDEELFEAIGDTQWREDKPLRTGMAIVTSVDGDTITLDRPLPFDFANKGTTLTEIDLAKNVVLKGFTLKGAHGAADPGSFSNTITSEKGGMMLLLNGTQSLQMSDVIIRDAGSHGLVLGKTLDADVRDLTVDGAHNKGSAGNGYGIWIRDVYDSKFSGLNIFDTRHAVLFASFTSAVGNSVQVDKTNRDINFHGGLDYDNFVVVDWSVRNSTEQGYMAAVTFVNPGTDYGAPTDPEANTIRFAKVVGTAREDIVFAVHTGADIATMAGQDILGGGRRDDRLDGGTGHDTILASGGRDTILGGQGTDLVLVGAEREDVRFVQQGGRLGMVWGEGVTWMTDVESLRFNDGTLSVGEAVKQASHLQLRTGQPGFDWATSAKGIIAGEALEGIRLTGKAGATALGNDLNNRVIGSDGGDAIILLSGDDKGQGGKGADLLSGGEGNDSLFGGRGRDVLNGGLSDDRLTGGRGADLFIAGVGRDVVTDFSRAQGDRFEFQDVTMAEVLEALEDWARDGSTAEGLRFRYRQVEGQRSLSIEGPGELGLIFLGLTADDLLVI